MSQLFEAHKRLFADLGFIFYRNIVSLVNGIIFAVVILLFIFEEKQAGVFISLTLVANMFLGLLQDIRAKLALERLQLLSVPKAVRMNGGKEETVSIEQIQKGDSIKLKIGDQVPCDGELLEAKGFEVSEALITGESDSFPREAGEKVLAGSIVAAGFGVMRAETVFAESRISKMTEDIKKYTINLSPIQRSMDTIVIYTGYALVAVLSFVIIRGFTIDEVYVRIVKTVAALTSTLAPQGLIVATTLLFAFGATALYQKRILLQEVNAMEKLGRIKNLCVDKTGTLTENELTVENMYVPDKLSRDSVENLAAAYLFASGDSSQTMRAIKKFLGREYREEAGGVVAFSSKRQFGAVALKGEKETVVLAGAPDAFLSHFKNEEERKWLEDLIDTHSKAGKRLITFAEMEGAEPPHSLRDTDRQLSLIAVFLLHNDLRKGVREMVDFFQDRGTIIRVISGDNEKTVEAIAESAGIKNTTATVTGNEMEKWSASDFAKQARNYAIFARVKPEQKEKIISALKLDGFTTMIGDGANDALAIKKADLGISMFDGAPATRQLSSVVLLENSFSAFPSGTRLADNIIKNIEILAGLFLNQVMIGFFLFLILAFFGYTYPFVAQNITLINYFTVGIPGIPVFYWAMQTNKKTRPDGDKGFLRRVLPYAVFISLVEAIGAACVFALSPSTLKAAESNTLVLLAFVIFGFIFFALAPRVYGVRMDRDKKVIIALFGVLETFLLWFVFSTPALVTFFSLSIPSVKSDLNALSVILVFGYIQYRLTRSFFFKKET